MIVARLKDNCCVEMIEKERIISVSTARLDGRSHVQRQGLMEGATFEDLKGNLSKHVTIGVVTVCRPKPFQRSTDSDDANRNLF